MGAPTAASVIGRYAIYDEIASGGMATVHYGRLIGPIGFSRPVAIKKLHPHLSKDQDFISMFMDEARLAARIRHPNVVATLDIVTTDDKQFLLVMEYVEGETLSRLMRRAKARGERLPVSVSCAMIVGALQGMHAAHEATNEDGKPLNIVHRDISPQNIMVGHEGIPRLLDFGVAKAVGRLATTRDGQLKGKLPYMAPELLSNGEVTRAVDIYAAAVVFWEMLTGERLFAESHEAATFAKIMNGPIDPPSTFNKDVPKELDAIVMKGLSRAPSDRFPTAREMAREIEKCAPLATTSSVGEWVESLAHDALQQRARKVAEIESVSDVKPLLERLGTPAPQSGSGERVKAELGKKEMPFDEAEPTLEQTLGVNTGDLIASEKPDKSRTAPAEDELEKAKPPKNRRAIAAAILVLGAIIGVSVAMKLRSVGQTQATIAPPPPQQSAVSTAAATEPPAVTTAAPITTTAPPPTHSASPVVSVAPPKPVHTNPVVHTKPANPDCDPPYTIDARGIKKYKVDCL